MTEPAKRRTLFRHPLAAVGGALFIAGGFFFVILLLLDLTGGTENPYRALVTFVLAPAIVTLGLALFLVSVWLQVRAARKKGEKVKFRLSIEPTDPGYIKNLWLFLGLCAALIFIVGYSGTRAFEATDSVTFCGETCHTVMEPQNVTYHHSPHARVKCVDCHIGPGASFWVKSKVDGLRQVWATALDSYSRPIETPVTNLRPAQETCEECHWPEQFYGTKILNRTYYRSDEDNSPWTIHLLMKIGGGNPRAQLQEGIHWHMLTANTVDYIAADEKRQVISWVQVTDGEGRVTTYHNEDVDDPPDLDGPGVEVRRFDCMDCHNRPSHIFLPPALALNLALRARTISPELPYVRRIGLDLLNAEYAVREEAEEAIRNGLKVYYDEKHPELADSKRAEIQKATETLLTIYHDNFFPEMKTDYRARETHLSHFVNDGCFRCHNESMVNDEGEHLAYECRTCHLIVAQGPSESIDDLEMNLAGLEFKHPEEIDEMWRDMKCTECHTPESGY
jgi:hypothetical protein